MRIVAQTVINASVAVDRKSVGAIKNGLLLYLGIEPNDTETDADWLIGKMSKMRLFKDVDGVAFHKIKFVIEVVLGITE